MPEAERRLPYQPALDGVRALSILAVLLFHACALAGMPRSFRGGFLGVTVFFVVSGYLITSLLLREANRTSRVDVLAFWARRLRRLAPAALAVVLFAIVITPTSWSGWPGFRAADAFAGIWSAMNWYLIALGSTQVIRGLGPLSPYWSLAIEEQFYVLLALAMTLAVRMRAPARALGIGFAAVWLVSLGVGTMSDASVIALEFSLVHRAGELATGGLLAVALLARPTLPAEMAPALRWAGPGCLAAIMILFLTASYDPPWLLHGGFLVVAAASAVVLVAAQTPGLLRTALSNRLLVWVGTLSYSLYLVHWPVGLLLNANTSLHRWGSVAVQIVASFAVAIALHHLIEQPLRYRWSRPSATTLWVWAAASVATSLLAVVVLAW